MNNGLKNAIIFASGIAVGSVTAWKILKTKYDQIAREEIESVREALSTRRMDDSEARKKADEAKEKPSITEYTSRIDTLGYHQNVTESKSAEQTSKIDIPYVISPEEFGEFEDYETISLTWYADQILTDDCDELVEDVEETVGFESLSHFGEYEEDAVHVRNDRLKADYEILRDVRKYSDVVRKGPHPKEE